jgi:hypothetical protein
MKKQKFASPNVILGWSRGPNTKSMGASGARLLRSRVPVCSVIHNMRPCLALFNSFKSP